jgi:asparagine synthase (glutamine-hydrolysing)
VCGIAGFAGSDLDETAARDGVRRMCDAITHRGPDSDGIFVAPGIAMGMRRLSIIDVQGGRQPISNEDGTITVVFNGEIYNHHALRARLVARGHRFATRSDTEVLVHLYEEMGTDMVGELHGMFAFSIWDANRQRLLIARDHCGQKPLSYLPTPGGLLYCSELRSIMALRPDLLRVSGAAVVQFLSFGYVPDPGSIFEGARKLPPGHYLTWSRDAGIDVRRYWRSPAPDPQAPRSGPELVETLRGKLDKAVASHLESEVPLGAFLSGGLDSSTVVALMSRHASGRVKTFSIGFSEAEFDESPMARRVAAHFATDHTELIVRPDVDAIFESIATMFDEPFGDASAIPTFLVSQLARRDVTVALSGDGGDELFGGYSRYRNALAQSTLPAPLGSLLSGIGRLLPHSTRGRNRLIDLGRTRWGRFASQVIEPVRTDEGGVARADLAGALRQLQEQIAEVVAEVAGEDHASSLMRIDIATYLPGDILTKVDRTSMAVSLEARVPLLDVELIEFAQRLPGHVHVSAAQGKQLLRQAIRGLVPDFLFDAPKRGFAVPLGPWFRGPLRHRIEALRSPPQRLAQYVDRAAVTRIATEHLSGRRDHSPMLWRLMVLDHWLGAFAAGRLARSPHVPTLQG